MIGGCMVTIYQVKGKKMSEYKQSAKRRKIQEEYVTAIIDSMDVATMDEYIREKLNEELDYETDTSLYEIVSVVMPELLKEEEHESE